MSSKKLGVAILGCGNIAEAYAQNLSTYSPIDLIGMADLEPQRAEALAAKFGCRAYPSLEAMLADDAVDLVVNLTIHHAHQETTTRCLEAGKHVHSEKPLALTYEGAQALVELARQKGLRLGCSPYTYMGEAQQTAWKLIREGRLGPIRVVYAEVNWGRIEAWHPAPGPFYQVGALFDVGVYPLTLLTTIFGPARKVWAYGTVLHPDRVTQEGVPFHIETPDFVVALVELENGPLIRLTTDFYVSRRSSKQDGVEFHGDQSVRRESHIGQRLKKRVALFRITQRLIRQRGVTPLMYQYGETVITQRKRWLVVVRRGNLAPEKNHPRDGS